MEEEEERTGESANVVVCLGGQELTGLQCANDANDRCIASVEKIKKEKREREVKDDQVVQMEDGEGNVMPERIYLDLQKQGIL